MRISKTPGTVLIAIIMLMALTTESMALDGKNQTIAKSTPYHRFLSERDEILDACEYALLPEDGNLAHTKMAMYCIGYVSGFRDGRDPPELPFCLPANISNEQVIRVFVNAMEQHKNSYPDTGMVSPAWSHFEAAMQAAFPCPKNKWRLPATNDRYRGIEK